MELTFQTKLGRIVRGSFMVRYKGYRLTPRYRAAIDILGSRDEVKVVRGVL